MSDHGVYQNNLSKGYCGRDYKPLYETKGGIPVYMTRFISTTLSGLHKSLYDKSPWNMFLRGNDIHFVIPWEFLE